MWNLLSCLSYNSNGPDNPHRPQKHLIIRSNV